MTLFDEQFEQEAIERIRKFARIAEKMGFDVCVGFSGGKDSQVVLDLVRRSGIQYKAYFNHAFESQTTLQFIRKYYPDVIWRREQKAGWIQNIWQNHNCLLPTTEKAYCCVDYKHNPKQVDACSIVGVRRAESAKRANRKVFETKSKTTQKQNKALFREYFTENCTGSGSPSIIQLKPIVDWSDENVWQYIHTYNLPINPEYQQTNRVGCLICPKANISRNAPALLKYPKLIDCIIYARSKRANVDWMITAENKDYTNNKVEYICRWLNHSFRPFTKKQAELCEKIKENYNKTKSAK